MTPTIPFHYKVVAYLDDRDRVDLFACVEWPILTSDEFAAACALQGCTGNELLGRYGFHKAEHEVPRMDRLAHFRKGAHFLRRYVQDFYEPMTREEFEEHLKGGINEKGFV